MEEAAFLVIVVVEVVQGRLEAARGLACRHHLDGVGRECTRGRHGVGQAVARDDALVYLSADALELRLGAILRQHVDGFVSLDACLQHRGDAAAKGGKRAAFEQ